MPIGIACVKCRQPLHVPDEQAGQVVVCPHCHQAMPVPFLLVAPQPSHQGRFHPDKPEPDQVDHLLDDLRARAGRCRPLPAGLPDEAHVLGEPISYRDESGTLQREAVVLAAAGLVLGVVFLRLVDRPTGLAVVGLVVLVVAGLAFYHLLLRQPVGYWFCTGGFVRARRGEAPEWVTWEDVESIVGVHGPHVTHRGVVCTPHGQFHLFSREAIDYVTRRAHQAQVPLFLLRLAQGQRVKLRPFVLEPTRLVRGEESRLWSDLAEVSLSRKELVVTLRNGEPWQHLPAEQAYLPSVLIAVCNEMIRLFRNQVGA
jgi:hypothetical protein